MARVSTTLRRSWRSLLAITFLTQALPSAILYLAAFGVGAGGAVFGDFDVEAGSRGDAGELVPLLAALVAALLVGTVIVLFAHAVGWAAATWSMVREAAGEPARIGAALRYGLSRAAGLTGWSVLSTLLIALGLFACVLPGVYVACGLAMLGPIYLFERKRPFSGSFSALHRQPGLILGRSALVGLVVFGPALVLNLTESILTSGADGPDTAVISGVFTVLTILIAAPLSIFQLIALNLTYAEQRARTVPVTTPQLAYELG